MKLVSYAADGGARLGVLAGARVVDLARAGPALGLGPMPVRAEDFFDDLATCDPRARRIAAAAAEGAPLPPESALALDGLAFLPPIRRPPKCICVARNFAEHAREAGLQVSEIPIMFARFGRSFVGHGEPVVVPAVSRQVDWEGELAVIVGRATAGRITRDAAMDHVWGYSIFNDVTVRDYQFRVTQYTAGKNFRASGPFGPWIVTADEIADPHRLTITTRVNGTVMQSASTADMIFDIPTILASIAEWIDLEPGDVIPTGTPAGVGFKRKPPVFLAPGDRVEVAIAGLGVLANPVVAEG
ncbi:MAG: fumarylacetoacetate hydrolase family protein [Rhodobacteraceae bacterium]|nr:fumarylacetoacetate hydrolase family protein [Paracoccaceae bacterium]